MNIVMPKREATQISPPAGLNGKTNYLFKKIRDTKGTFHAKMGLIKDRNGNGPNRSRRY